LFGTGSEEGVGANCDGVVLGMEVEEAEGEAEADEEGEGDAEGPGAFPFNAPTTAIRYA
jgi:hypothetical protein